MQCWGRNANGLLGNGSTSAGGVPITVDFVVCRRTRASGGSMRRATSPPTRSAA